MKLPAKAWPNARDLNCVNLGAITDLNCLQNLKQLDTYQLSVIEAFATCWTQYCSPKYLCWCLSDLAFLTKTKGTIVHVLLLKTVSTTDSVS